MNPENRWIKKAETIPWNEIEEQYASLFPSETGMPAKPLWTAPGSLLIQKQYGYSDRELVEQQKYMYDNKVHRVKNRIVSISQPYIRPIVRGRPKSPVEFGAKLDMSIDEKGIARLEYLCFDAYNECDVLTGAIHRYCERTGHYPERVLVNQIYRNRANRAYCKKHGIRISGLALGRPRALPAEEKKQAYADYTDRIEVERGFSLAKRCYGLGLIKTKLDTTTRSSIALSILAMNVNYLAAVCFCAYLILAFSRYKCQKNLSKELTFSIFA